MSTVDQSKIRNFCIIAHLLQSMHGALLGELSPHSFGNNKKAPHVSV